MRNKILILTVSRKVSLVRAFKDAGWYVIGQDIDPNAVALKFCDEVAIPDKENGPYDMILPTRDADLKIGTHRTSDETIDICTDKMRFSDWCLNNGFNAPKTLYTQETRERGVFGRAFIKPRFSSSANKAEGFVECVYQERVVGEEYSVDVFLDFNSNVISVVPRIRLKTLNGESCVTKTVSLTAPFLESVKLAKSLRLVGHNVLQGFFKDGLMTWVDCNIRYGGASAVAIKAGCLSPQWHLKLINGESVKPCIGNYEVGLLGRSYSEWDFGS